MIQPEVLVVVPCYNEEHRISLPSFQSFAAANPSFNFLFVDDGSSDQTRILLLDFCAQNPDQFGLLPLDMNGGKAEAVRRGFLKGFEQDPVYLAFWDADLATPLETLPHFLEVFNKRKGTDVLLGSRVKLLGRDIRRQAVRHYLGRIFATFASIVLNLGVYDTQCGAKMFRVTPELKRIFEKPFVSRWIFDVEIIKRLLVQQNGKPNGIYEYPLLVWHDIKGSKLKPFDFLKAFMDLLRIYWDNR